MKKITSIALCAVMLTSCATVFTVAKKSDFCQNCKPETGKRKMRTGFLIADLACLFFVGPVPLLWDMANGKIYKPCDKIKK